MTQQIFAKRQIVQSQLIQGELFGTNNQAQNEFAKYDIDGQLLALVLAHSDVSIDLGNGCVGLKISPKQAARPDLMPVFGRHINNICDIVVIWSDWEASVITILHQNAHIEKRLKNWFH